MMTTPRTPGYSGKPLTEKLGIKPGMRVAVVRRPDELPRWLSPLPLGAKLVDSRARNVELAMLFAMRASELRREIPGLLARIGDGGMLWVCWPKQSSGVATDVTEQLLRDEILPTGWVDVKVCAVSDIWSGLKFLRRKARP